MIATLKDDRVALPGKAQVRPEPAALGQPRLADGAAPAPLRAARQQHHSMRARAAW